MHQPADAREDRIDQNSQDHGAGSAEAIAKDAEDESTGGPSKEKNRGEFSAVFFDLFIQINFFLVGEGLLGMGMKDFFEGWGANQIHQVLIHRVKEPAECSDGEHDPAIAIEPLIPFESGSVALQFQRGWHDAEITGKKAGSPVRSWGW